MSETITWAERDKGYADDVKSAAEGLNDAIDRATAYGLEVRMHVEVFQDIGMPETVRVVVQVLKSL